MITRSFRLMLALLLCAALHAQNLPRTQVVTWHMDRAACARMVQLVQLSPFCVQNIFVIAQTDDPSIRGFEITIEYTDAQGQTKSQSAYVKASERNGSARFTDVDDVILRRVTAEPQKSAGGQAVVTY